MTLADNAHGASHGVESHLRRLRDAETEWETEVEQHCAANTEDSQEPEMSPLKLLCPLGPALWLISGSGTNSI